MKLTLLRHGITEGNRRRLYYGSTDLPLLSEGWAALEALRTRGGYPQATQYYTSGMIRTEQTLLALYGPVPHEVLPGLREMDFGTFEMRAYEELKHDPAYLAWLEGDVEANLCPGGESGHIVTKRALEALAPILEAEEDAVCVTHGGVIGGLLAQWFPSAEGRYAWTPAPGSGFQIAFQHGIPEEVWAVPDVSVGI